MKSILELEEDISVWLGFVTEVLGRWIFIMNEEVALSLRTSVVIPSVASWI
jgi:hypothetical protein